jgi:hypothetical protein
MKLWTALCVLATAFNGAIGIGMATDQRWGLAAFNLVAAGGWLYCANVVRSSERPRLDEYSDG